MNRITRSLIAVASATALAATVATAAHADPVDIGDGRLDIPKANTLWTSAALGDLGFAITDATIFADTVDPADPWGGTEVNYDAFYGALSVFVKADETAAATYYGLPDCTGTCTYVVDVTTSAGDTVVQGPVEVLYDLEVSVQQRFYAGGDLARVVATYTNPTGDPITVFTGSHSVPSTPTFVEGHSSGDGFVAEDDHWIITGDNGYDAPSIVTTAWSAPGATLLPDFAVTAYDPRGDGRDSAVAFELTVQPGQTVHLAYFVKINGWEVGAEAPVVLGADLAAAATISPGYDAAITAAVAGAAEFNTFSGRLTAGLTPGTVVLNWGTVRAAPADPATPVTSDPTFTG